MEVEKKLGVAVKKGNNMFLNGRGVQALLPGAEHGSHHAA
jgi:hypothetical protein